MSGFSAFSSWLQHNHHHSICGSLLLAASLRGIIQQSWQRRYFSFLLSLSLRVYPESLHEVTLGHCFICGLFRLPGRAQLFASRFHCSCEIVPRHFRRASRPKISRWGKASLDPSESRVGSVLKKRVEPLRSSFRRPLAPRDGRSLAKGRRLGRKIMLDVRSWPDTDAGSPRTLTMPVEDDETGDAFS